ncbi:MAG: acyl-CoA dehydrogenase [Planctomycetaceae bacterium]|nr:acyl-CoA dehydrogenase [Planctomycetaceae bacterium]
MRELLSDRNLDYQARARDVAERVVRPNAARWDREESYPFEVIEELKKERLTGVWIPEEYGGQGGSVLDLCLVVEQLSRACGGVGVAYAVNALGSFPILLQGTEEQRKRWLPGIASGEKMVSFCLSEKEAGSDAGSLAARAEKKGGGYVVTGDKKWTTNAAVADLFTVFAVTDPERGARGISAFVVDREMDGFEVGHLEEKMGIRCVPVNETHFKGVECGPDRLLGGREGTGFLGAMGTLDRARPGVAAQAVGLADGALDLAVKRAADRRQFGQSIINFQGLQFMLADMATQVEAARQLVYSAARAIDEGVKSPGKIAAMCKVFATDVAMRVTTDAVQVFGGYGYLRDYPIEKYMRDAKITQIYEGTNQIQRLVIGRALIREAASG